MDIDFDRTAFVRGFWSGLAAPASLFVHRQPPPVPEIQKVVPPSRDVPSAINGDWQRVGDTMRTVIGRYEREAK